MAAFEVEWKEPAAEKAWLMGMILDVYSHQAKDAAAGSAGNRPGMRKLPAVWSSRAHSDVRQLLLFADVSHLPMPPHARETSPFPAL